MHRVFSRFHVSSGCLKEEEGRGGAVGDCRIKSGAKLSPSMQLQWLRYASICRPVERHQFIIIALNRPAPCTPTPCHSILPAIVQFRFYAPVAPLRRLCTFPLHPLPLPLRTRILSSANWFLLLRDVIYYTKVLHSCGCPY